MNAQNRTGGGTMEIKTILHRVLLASPPNLWDAFAEECRKHYDAPAHSFVDLRVRDNKKVRGDLFEEFCVQYLKHARGFTNVWRLEDVPVEILETLGMGRRDMGIDLVAEKDGKYAAVQCKYKTWRTHTVPIVTWKAVSTFYALCMRTGPWDKYIVMTNCAYVRHQGKKTPKDLSICQKTLQATTKEQWTQMCELKGDAIAPATKPLTAEELRAARLKFLAAQSVPVE